MRPALPDGVSFAAGRYGQGLLVDGADTLSYETAGNLNREQGAIEFWVRPNWDGNDGRDYNFFEVGHEWFNRIRITKDGANNLRLMVWDDHREYGVIYNVGHWRAGEWHHVAATWTPSELALYTDGELRDRATGTRPPQSLASRLFIGSDSGGGSPAQAVIDEFRISDVPRVGNSDTCTRILVADSGNNRIQAFDALGGFLTAYGTIGDGPDRFNSPQGLAVDDRGRVIVADSGNNRLQLLSFDGRNFGYLGSIGGFNWPTGVWAYGSDRILVADTGANAIKELIPEGDRYVEKSYAPYNAPHGVAADASGLLIIADTGNRRVVTIPGALPALTPTPAPEEDLGTTGLVYDASMGERQPLPHAEVSADACQQVFPALAGPDGRYSLLIPGTALDGCDHIAFLVRMTGYADLAREVPVAVLRAQPQQDFGLWPAANISVSTTEDELNADGDCSLREAIQAANTDLAADACPAGSGMDTISVPAGRYELVLAGAAKMRTRRVTWTS